MSKEWFDKADRSQDFSKVYVGSAMDTNVVVLHSTEGTGWPGYSGGAVAPNMTIKADFANKKVVWRQHFASNRSSRALENRSGGVETNTLNCFQIELVGTCDPNTHNKWKAAGVQHIYMPEAPDWFLQGIVEILHWLKQNYSRFTIKNGAPRGWVGPEKSPASLTAPQRMSFSEWNNSLGIVAHQHVPENGHWDVGAFQIDRLVQLATGEVIPETPDTTEPKVYDKMDPASYFIGATGDHITWLGNRVVTHLNALGIKPPYLVGPGPEFTETDQRGVQLFQEAQGWTGADADGFPGPETLKRLAAAPVVSEPEPTPEPVVTVKLRSQNVAGYNAPNKPGVLKYKTFIPAIAQEAKDSGADVLLFQELSADEPDQRPLMDAKLAPEYKRVSGGTDGRYIYRRTTVKSLAGGHFAIADKNEYNRDDKQAAWYHFSKNGVEYFAVSIHTENQGTSDVQVRQTLDFLYQSYNKAKSLGVANDKIILMGDFNNDSQVVAAMKAKGWYEISDGKMTFSGWTGGSYKQLDHAFMRTKNAKGHTDPCKHSDHDAIEVVV